MTAKEVVRTLRAAGFRDVGQKGSHLKLRHDDGRQTIVPTHGGDLAPGTLRAIEKQTGAKLK